MHRKERILVPHMFVKKRNSVHNSVVEIKPQVIDDEENWEQKQILKIAHFVDHCWDSVEQ